MLCGHRQRLKSNSSLVVMTARSAHPATLDTRAWLVLLAPPAGSAKGAERDAAALPRTMSSEQGPGL